MRSEEEVLSDIESNSSEIKRLGSLLWEERKKEHNLTQELWSVRDRQKELPLDGIN